MTTVRIPLTQAEAHLICDALNGTVLTTELRQAGLEDFTGTGFLVMEIADAISLNALDQKWGVDGDHLLAALQDASPEDAQAIIEAVRRFWDGDYNAEDAVRLAFWPNKE